MDVESGNQVRLTENSAFDGYPTWSSDGKIAFISARDGFNQIYVMDATGQYQIKLNAVVVADEPMSWTR